MSTDWPQSGSLYLWEGDIVDSLSAEDCRAKAIDCAIKAETLEDPWQKAAMIRYAEWWSRLAEYRAKTILNDPRSDRGS